MDINKGSGLLKRISSRVLARLGATALCLACALPASGKPMVDCNVVTPTTEVNNLAPVPLGLVDNMADEPQGTPLPAQGVVSAATNPVDPRGVHTNIEWGTEAWKEPTRGCKWSRQVLDFWPAMPLDLAAPEALFPTIVYFLPTRRTTIGSPAAISMRNWHRWHTTTASTSSRWTSAIP